MTELPDSTSPLQLLNGLTAGQFLAEYWQKKPLLIRQALPDFEPPLEADELAGLACEPQIESRIISGAGTDKHWQLRHGPFSEQTFDELGERDWTLLVQAVDHYLPEVAQLKKHFRFIPDWRLDDVMVSFAAPGGSVGPHLDQYDVFLLQGQGQRRWQVGERIIGDAPLLPHPELQLLRDFNSTSSTVLEQGDMLYLPPGFPHWGIALDACISYSMGFRAPSHQEILSDYCDHALAKLDPQLRYSDGDLHPASNPGLITTAATEKIRDIVSGLLDEQNLAQWFGCYMTRPKYDNTLDLPGVEDDTDTLEPHARLQVDDASRLAYRVESGSTILYADGEAYPGTGDDWREFVSNLCASHTVSHTVNQCFTAEMTAASGPRDHDTGHDTIVAAVREMLRRGVLIAADN